jgi:hypothetical protein
MKSSIERRLSHLESTAEPPKKQIKTFLDLVIWSNEDPRDNNVEFAPWVGELGARCDHESGA